MLYRIVAYYSIVTYIVLHRLTPLCKMCSASPRSRNEDPLFRIDVTTQVSGPRHVLPVSVKINTPSDKKTAWKISSERTKSAAELQFLQLGCMAKAHAKGVFSQTPVVCGV